MFAQHRLLVSLVRASASERHGRAIAEPDSDRRCQYHLALLLLASTVGVAALGNSGCDDASSTSPVDSSLVDAVVGTGDGAPVDAIAPDVAWPDVVWPDVVWIDATAADPDGAALWPDAPGLDAAAPPDSSPDAPPADIAERLAAIEGMEIVSETAGANFRFFVLEFEQPADHSSPAKGRFSQRMTLLHRAEAQPMVMMTDGYYINLQNNEYEVTSLLEANQLVVEHRFFEESRPAPADWNNLTIRQAAADHHRINQALHPIYRGPWITTGHSKGGMTAVYYRRFYPDDVDATVAYVAPLNHGVNDDRYPAFLEQVGDATCRQALDDFQKIALFRRESLVQMLEDWASLSDLTFDVIGIDQSFEGAVIELPFSFWQYHDPAECAGVPDGEASNYDVLAFFWSNSMFYLYADQMITMFLPYFYQTVTELGYPASRTEHLAGLLQYDDTSGIPPDLLPPGVDPVFDPEAMRDIGDWVAGQGKSIMFIYGEYDPWTAGMFRLGQAVDSYSFTVPHGNHSSVIDMLPEPQQSEALQILRRWARLPAEGSGDSSKRAAVRQTREPPLPAAVPVFFHL
ncbi:MAG: S28 family serine protease [Pseudomonadota bacterium]